MTRAFTYSAEGSASTLAVSVGKLRPTDDVHRFAYDGVDRTSIAPLGSFRVTALSNQISLRLADQRSPVALVSVEVGHWNFRFYCLPTGADHLVGDLVRGQAVNVSVWRTLPTAVLTGALPCGGEATAGTATVGLWAPVPAGYRVYGGQTTSYVPADRLTLGGRVVYNTVEQAAAAAGHPVAVSEFTIVPPGDVASLFIDNTQAQIGRAIAIGVSDRRGYRRICVPVLTDTIIGDLLPGAETVVSVYPSLGCERLGSGNEPATMRFTFFERLPAR